MSKQPSHRCNYTDFLKCQRDKAVLLQLIALTNRHEDTQKSITSNQMIKSRKQHVSMNVMVIGFKIHCIS